MTTTPEAPALVVYGGTFDPPHLGHLGCVEQVLRRFPRCRVLVMPSPAPAGSHGAHKAPVAPYPARLTLCEATFKNLGPRVHVSQLESELPAPHYTINTLRLLASRERGPLGLLIGADQLATFTGWREPAGILSLASLIVVPRASEQGDARGVVATLAQALASPVAWHEPERAARLTRIPQSIYLLDSPVTPAASRTIRERLAAGQPVPEGWLAPDVAASLLSSELYGKARSSR